MAIMERICAWCKKHLGSVEVDGEEDMVSHGICKKCSLDVLLESIANTQKKIEETTDEAVKVRLEKILEKYMLKAIELQKEIENEASDSIGPVSLMRLTEIADPDELLKDYKKEDIVVEHKLDGWKLQVIKTDNVKIYSRKGEDKTENFPELVKSLDFLPKNTLVEGELVYWEGKKQDISKVTSVAGSSPENAREKVKELPGKLKIHLYDILWLNNKNLTEKSFKERRKALESIIKKSDVILLTKQYEFSKWQDAMNNAIEEGGEGIVLKLKDKPYEYRKLGESEAKPKDVMFKYKGGKGKSDSDDFVVYDYETSDKGKFKALFGQYYKGKLYHISEISNFSKEDEEEIKNKLKDGNIVIEIGFQERLPGGLRHQKYIKIRDDKSPKDATMNEFHVKNLNNFDIVKTASLSSFAKYIDDIERALEGTKQPSSMPATNVSVPGVDFEKAFSIISHLESGNKSETQGDAGTSLGLTQVHGPYLLSWLANDPEISSVGLTPNELRKMSAEWKAAIQKVRQANIWHKEYVDNDTVSEFVSQNPRSVIRRMEGTTIKYSPSSIIKKVGNQYIKYTLNTEVLSDLGIDINSPIVQAGLNRAFKEYITDNVMKSAIAQQLLLTKMPQSFLKFRRAFSRQNIKNNTNGVKNIIDRASVSDFSTKVRGVIEAIKQYGYDTTAPGAFNVYQLIAISNASGLGRVQQFLRTKKPFAPGNLQYLKRANPTIERMTGIASNMPVDGGLSGFGETRVASHGHKTIVETIITPEMVITFWKTLKNLKNTLNQDPKLKEKIWKEYEQELNKKLNAVEFEKALEKEVEKYIIENWERIPKTASYTLYFPGQYAEDIRSGKRRMTIRIGEVPFKENDVVRCMTYSNTDICNAKIISKNTMSITRIEKAFGKYVAKELKHKFGDNQRFEVIRFEPYMEQGADDKWDEILIDKDGVKLTRQQIKDHYLKPDIRKKIMSVIKDKPVLVYIGIGKNENILKRNHDNKQITITNDDESHKDSPNNYLYWIDRRVLSFHEVFGTETDKGFVDLDLHGDFPISKAKKYAKELEKKIKETFDVKSHTYQSGGTGLHVEFELDKKIPIDSLREQLKELLDELNEDWEDVTTGVVKGSGMRSDISTLHNKGSLRVPYSIGENNGKIKKPLEAAASDWSDSGFSDPRYGVVNSIPEEEQGDSGAIIPQPTMSMDRSDGVGSYFALSNRTQMKKLARRVGVESEYMWIFGDNRLFTLQNVNGEKELPMTDHVVLLNNKGHEFISDEKNPRGFVTYYDDGRVEVSTYDVGFRDLPLGVQNLVEEYFELIPGQFKITILSIPKKFYKALASKNILILVAPKDFCEQDYFISRKVFSEKFNFNMTVTSNDKIAEGSNGIKIYVDKIDESDSKLYDALFVVGGNGMIEFSQNEKAQALIQSFVKEKKPVAMICHASLLGIKSGVLNNIKITGLPSIVKEIKQEMWTGMPIEKDGSIFTAIDDSENLAFAFGSFASGKTIIEDTELPPSEAAQKLLKIWKTADLISQGISEEEFWKLHPELKDYSEEEDIPEFEKEFVYKPKKKTTKTVPAPIPETILKKKPEEKLKKAPEIKKEPEKSTKAPEIKKEPEKPIERSILKPLSYYMTLSIEELINEILTEAQHQEAENEILEKMNPIIKELFGEEIDISKPATEEDIVESLERREKRKAVTIFGVKLQAPIDKSGKVLDQWPEIEKKQKLPEEAKEIFSYENITDDRKLSEIFSDPSMKAWNILTRNPDLLQSWILPGLIVSIGKKWFNRNKVRTSMGSTFRKLGNTPFGMFDSNDADMLRKNEDVSIEDLPKAKRYIQEINNLIAQYANIYFSQGYTSKPIGGWIKTALEREMKRIVADANNFKEIRYPVCAVCKRMSPKGSVIPRMREINIDKKSLWECPACKRKIEEINKNEIPTIEANIYKANKMLKEYGRMENQAKVAIEDAETPEQKEKNEKKLEEAKTKISEYNQVVENLVKQREAYEKERSSYESQLATPRWHTLCPNEKCPGQKIPLTSIDWNDDFWNDSVRAKEALAGLYKRFRIVPPKGKKFSIEQEAIESPKDPRFIPPKWLEDVPFICPFDGVHFTLASARGKGYNGEAGFLCDPWFRLEWKAIGDVKGGEIEEEIGEDTDSEELVAYDQLSELAKDIFLKKYWEQFASLEEYRKHGSLWEQAKTKKDLMSILRKMALYDSVRQFSAQDPKAYVGWLSGRELEKKLVLEGSKLTKINGIKNTTETKYFEVYTPILQNWVDKMLYAFGENWEKGFDSFNLKDWLVDNETEGLPSDGPGTFFVTRVESEVQSPEKMEKGNLPYGFKFAFQPKKLRGGPKGSVKFTRLLRVLGIWKISQSEAKLEIVPTKIAKAIISGKQNRIAEMTNHDFHRVALDKETTDLVPGDYVLVQALVMPGATKWAPINSILKLRQDTDDEKVFENFGELAMRNNDDTEFWSSFVTTVKGIKERLKGSKKTEQEKLKELVMFLNKRKKLSVRSSLKEYKNKRKFDKTTEPEGKKSKENKHRFVIQKHDAKKAGTHFDLRLENDEGTMSSWAIPKRKMPKGKEKLLAMETESHPVEYASFSGDIPEGEYGAGTVKIHDSGKYEEIEKTDSKVVFKLSGKKETGTFVLLKTDGKKWLIFRSK